MMPILQEETPQASPQVMVQPQNVTSPYAESIKELYHGYQPTNTVATMNIHDTLR
jgi:hypothetical protein